MGHSSVPACACARGGGEGVVGGGVVAYYEALCFFDISDDEIVGAGVRWFWGRRQGQG